jgi:hypothetical protein
MNEQNKNQEEFNIFQVQDQIRRIPKSDLVQVTAGKPENLSLFQEQQLLELKSNTSTMRIRTDILKRAKLLSKAYKIKNHGKLMNAIMDGVLNKLGY